jgi:hypothetical protein
VRSLYLCALFIAYVIVWVGLRLYGVPFWLVALILVPLAARSFWRAS